MNICSNLNIKNNPDKIIKMNDKFKYYNSSEINELELNKLKFNKITFKNLIK